MLGECGNCSVWEDTGLRCWWWGLEVCGHRLAPTRRLNPPYLLDPPHALTQLDASFISVNVFIYFKQSRYFLNKIIICGGGQSREGCLLVCGTTSCGSRCCQSSGSFPSSPCAIVGVVPFQVNVLKYFAH